MDNRHYGFSINGVDNEQTIANVAELNKLLESVGITINLEPYEGMDRMGYLGICINTDTFKKIRTRNAGRKKNYSKGKNYNVRPTVGEVLEWRRTMTHQEIIEKIGCPRATYYRRIKELAEVYGISFDNYNPDGDMLDFNFF